MAVKLHFHSLFWVGLQKYGSSSRLIVQNRWKRRQARQLRDDDMTCNLVLPYTNRQVYQETFSK